MKVMTVVGARPQFVKAAVVSRALRACEGVSEVVVHTGQHYDAEMSDVFFEQMQIPTPDHHLGIGSASHGAQTGRMLEAIEKIVLEQKPDVTLVYGDTNSTLAATLAAVKLHVPVAHVEAGLRSFNRRMPEEINRIATDHVSDRLYAPTATAAAHLSAEGIDEDRVLTCGDVMYDASLYYRDLRTYDVDDLVPERVDLSRGFVLATLHRAENTDDDARLRAAIEGLGQASRSTGLPVVLPLHPRTANALKRVDLEALAQEALTLIKPVGFFEMLSLEAAATLIATDSGGVQKEAYFFEVPCVTLRDETEWVELVESGWNRLAPPMEAEGVAAAITSAVGSSGTPGLLYGAGDAAVRIAEDLLDRYA